MFNSRALLQGASLNQVAAGFVASAEFAGRYGAGSSDADFVNTLYQNVLHRAGDAGGVQNWISALAGGASRADVLTGFSEFGENRGALNANPNQSYGETAEAQTERLYDAAFGRAPDPVGFNNWTHALLNGVTLQQAAASFISGPEYANRYGAATSNGAYVDALYQNTLHRAADAPGRAHWLDLLNGGALGRADLLVAFSEAPEHVRNVIGKDTAVSAGLLVDPSAHLGFIPIPTTITGAVRGPGRGRRVGRTRPAGGAARRRAGVGRRHPPEWHQALAPLLPRAAAGIWPGAARCLYELQRVPGDLAREVYAVDLPEAIRTFGRGRSAGTSPAPPGAGAVRSAPAVAPVRAGRAQTVRWTG